MGDKIQSVKTMFRPTQVSLIVLLALSSIFLSAFLGSSPLAKVAFIVATGAGLGILGTVAVWATRFGKAVKDVTERPMNWNVLIGIGSIIFVFAGLLIFVNVEVYKDSVMEGVGAAFVSGYLGVVNAMNEGDD